MGWQSAASDSVALRWASPHLLRLLHDDVPVLIVLVEVREVVSPLLASHIARLLVRARVTASSVGEGATTV